MAEFLGRSAGSLYGKRRRIGLPTRRVAKAEQRQRAERQSKTNAASAALHFDSAAPTGEAKRTRRRKSTAKRATCTAQEVSETLPGEPTISSFPIVPLARPVTEATATTQEALVPLQAEPPANPPATAPSDSPSEPPPSQPAEVEEKKPRTPRQAKPSSLSAETQPEWYAAVEDFMANRLPADVDTIRHYATKNHVITGVAILGGMKKTAIEEAAGFGRSGVNSHVDRLHLSSKGVRGEIFDRRQFDDAMKVLTPKADGVTHRLIFHAPGDHRIAVTVKRAARRRDAAKESRAKLAAAAKRRREEDAWTAGIEIRRGVSLRRLECLSRPFDMAI
ncbi:hypothetical protein [Methylosinus trichosporium]|uniref:hypothetical protein n=1 Tax=Methylosinus trichosporium TaxID=426 RepID=UPI0012FFD491|nr:hypothetical protein [Methylosinus trichosporium]